MCIYRGKQSDRAPGRVGEKGEESPYNRNSRGGPGSLRTMARWTWLCLVLQQEPSVDLGNSLGTSTDLMKITKETWRWGSFICSQDRTQIVVHAALVIIIAVSMNERTVHIIRNISLVFILIHIQITYILLSIWDFLIF